MTTHVEELQQAITDQQLRDQLLRQIVEWGHACAPDLAGQIGRGYTAQQLVPVLENLVSEGVLQHMVDTKDERKYEHPLQKRYELAK
jgi:flagellar biosynthesis component FlhA